MLSYLVYVSHRNDNCSQQEIQQILQACERNNSHSDATGVLLFSETKFIQYLEGDYRKIMELYDKIKVDPRHRNVVLVQVGNIDGRLFPSWQMGSKKINENKIEFQTNLTSDESRVFEGILAGNQQEGEKSLAIIKKFFH